MIDWLIAELADRQHGVVATWQLVALGLTHDDIRYRAKIGRLHRIYRGVCAVGHRNLTPKGHRMAAVLACGADAVLSHRSAAAHWGIGSPSYKTDVTTPLAKRSRNKIRAHTATLHEEDRTIHDGIPITSVARTILDLAARATRDQLTYLIEAGRLIAKAGFPEPRIRDAILQKAGVRVLRVTGARFDHDANGVLADIIALSRS